MNTLISEPLAKGVRFDEDNFYIELHDGRTLSTPLAFFPRLLNASTAERIRYEISGGGSGIHWEHLDEDISVKYLFLGIGDQTVRAKSA